MPPITPPGCSRPCARNNSHWNYSLFVKSYWLIVRRSLGALIFWDEIKLISQFEIFLALVTVGFKTILYKRKYNPMKLFSVIPFILFPSLLVLFFIWLQTKVTAIFLFFDGQIISILSQLWILPLMTTAVSQTEELTMNRSSLIVLFTFYFTYVVAFVLYGITWVENYFT